jgi:hypothetical protein
MQPHANRIASFRSDTRPPRHDYLIPTRKQADDKYVKPPSMERYRSPAPYLISALPRQPRCGLADAASTATSKEVVVGADHGFRPKLLTHHLNFGRAGPIKIVGGFAGPLWSFAAVLTGPACHLCPLPSESDRSAALQRIDVKGHNRKWVTETIKPLCATEQTSAGYARLLSRCRVKAMQTSSHPDSSGDAFSALAIPPAPSPGRWHCVSRRAIPMPPGSYPWPVHVRLPGEARQNRPRGRQAVSRLRP